MTVFALSEWWILFEHDVRLTCTPLKKEMEIRVTARHGTR